MAADSKGGYGTTNTQGVVSSHDGARSYGSTWSTHLDQPNPAGQARVATTTTTTTTTVSVPPTSPTKPFTSPAVTAPSSSASVRNGASVGPVTPVGIASAAGETGTKSATASGSPPAGSGQWGSGGAAVSGPLAPQTASRTMQSSTPAGTAPPSTTPVTTPPTPPILEGACAGGAYNPAGVAAFGSATGTSPTIACDYLPAASGWTGLDGAGGSLTGEIDKWRGSGYSLSLGVPMIPTDSGGTPVATLANGATGAYDGYFETLAQNLVAGGEGNAFLRLGWEFDGTWYAWSARTLAAEAAYASYFDQIVTSMRSVPGENFKFVWNPDASTFDKYATFNVKLAYPGNAYVDFIGVDEYDVSTVDPHTPADAWKHALRPELKQAQQFAAANGKPLVIPEWGLAPTSQEGFGDDPYYINSFHAWMTNPANNVDYECYFNSGQSVITGGNDASTGKPWPYSYPNGLAAFRADFG
jgi:hypothetical protein